MRRGGGGDLPMFVGGDYDGSKGRRRGGGLGAAARVLRSPLAGLALALVLGLYAWRLAGQVSALETTVAQKEEQIRAQQTSYARMRSDLHDARQRKAELEQRYDALSRELKEASDAHDKERTKTASHQADLERAHAAREEKERHAKEAEDRHALTSSELMEKDKELQEIHKRHAESLAMLADSERQVAELTAKAAAAEQAAAHESAEAQRVRTQLEQCEAKHARLSASPPEHAGAHSGDSIDAEDHAQHVAESAEELEGAASRAADDTHAAAATGEAGGETEATGDGEASDPGAAVEATPMFEVHETEAEI